METETDVDNRIESQYTRGLWIKRARFSTKREIQTTSECHYDNTKHKHEFKCIVKEYSNKNLHIQTHRPGRKISL